MFIAESSQLLGKANQEYKTFGGVVREGRLIITKLWQRDWTDRALIYLAFFVYILVVLYILKRRVTSNIWPFSSYL